MKKHQKISSLPIPVLACLLLLLVACGTLEVGMERTPTPGSTALATVTATALLPTEVTPTQTAPPPTETATQALPTATSTVTPPPPTAMATATPLPPTAMPTATAAQALPTATATSLPPTATPTPDRSSPLWVKYRSPKYGYGLALPCFWVVFPAVGTPSIMSYDEAFLRAHSVRGHWLNNEWPEGAVKIDVVVFEDVDPSLSLAEAASQRLTNESRYVHSTKEVTIGAHPAVLAELRDSQDASISYTLPIFRLAPDRILFFSIMPRRALTSPDVQAIITSLALSPEQGIAIPSTPPGGPVEGREVYVDQKDGYCFAYPSTFETGEVRPRQPGLVGPKLEEGTGYIRAGLTIQVQDVPADNTLAELANDFVSELSGASITRQPYTLYAEPAEMLEYVTGREGARDVLAILGHRRYHLSFTPSVSVFSRIAPDVDLLFEIVTSSFTFLPRDSWLAEPIPIYVILPGDAGQSGPAVGCGDSAVAIERGLPRTGTLVGDVFVALEELFSIKTATLEGAKYAHSLHSADVAVEHVGVGGGEMMYIGLSGTLLPVGSCADARMQAQILHTAFQHPGVDRVLVTLNGQNLKQLFDVSGTVVVSEPYRRSEFQ